MAQSLIAFVAYLEQDNLGVGYIASVLLQRGFSVLLIDMRESASTILQNLLDARPLVTGFSIVFQYHLDQFRDLMATLRSGGAAGHFCAGGHYPSFRYQELLQLAPELDSVVLFEGERTFAELCEAVREGREWRQLPGIARRSEEVVQCTGLRALLENIDDLPLPVRRPTRPEILGRKVLNILAGRGCLYDCSFCSIHSFYSIPPGRVQRVRTPEYVVREMQLHFHEEGVSVFLFQDDDFPTTGMPGVRWLDRFCKALRTAGIHDRVAWKASCRPNEIYAEPLSMMMGHGLCMVYLGIESGTRTGLEIMRKRISPEISLSAVRTIKNLNLPYEFGFMVFDPTSTFDSVRENLAFLDEICGDGSAAIPLGKMLPLAGTRIEAELRKQNRLEGPPAYEDYVFANPLLQEYFDSVSTVFRHWMHGDDGVMALCRWAHFQAAILWRFHVLDEGMRQSLRDTVASANRLVITNCSQLATVFRDSSRTERSAATAELGAEIDIRHTELAHRLYLLSDEMRQLAANARQP